MLSIQKTSCALALSLLLIYPAAAQTKMTRETAGLGGPVHTVREEEAQLFERREALRGSTAAQIS